MKLFLCLLLAASVAALSIEVPNYDGYKVFSVAAVNSEQFHVLKRLHLGGEFDFWTSPKQNGFTDIMATPDQISFLQSLLTLHGMYSTVKVENVGKIIQEEKIANLKGLNTRISFTAYQRWSVIDAFIDELAALKPNLASVETIGQTSEGRDIKLLKVSTGGTGKKAIFVDGVHHAREWISGAVVTWFMDQLVRNSDQYADILANIDFYFVPVLNIDGYEFSHTNTRLWRKTRKLNSGSTCRGVDPNRNYAFHWGGEGVSTNPCSDIFLGERAFSEPETKALSDYIVNARARGVDIRAYLTVHSYGQLWLCSWGYTAGVYPPDFPELLDLGNRAAAALRVPYNTRYQVGQGADMLYGVGGASDDWAKSIGIKYSYTLELRDTGSSGFVLPPAQIIPTATETWEAVKVVADQVIRDP